MADTDLIEYHKTGDVLKDTEQIIESAQKYAYRVVNTVLTLRNWRIGRRIAEEKLQGSDRAEYGATIVKNLADHLTEKYGGGMAREICTSTFVSIGHIRILCIWEVHNYRL